MAVDGSRFGRSESGKERGLKRLGKFAGDCLGLCGGKRVAAARSATAKAGEREEDDGGGGAKRDQSAGAKHRGSPEDVMDYCCSSLMQGQ